MRVNTVLLCLCACVLAFDNKLDSPSKRFLASLPESEKIEFLVFALTKGYTASGSANHNKTISNLLARSLPDPDSVNRFEALQVPENFEKNLYFYTKDTFHLSRQHIKSLIQSRRICHNRRKCISIDDIGTMCCPF